MTETFVLLAGKPTIVKDPNSRLDYTLDFSDWLPKPVDTIASVSFPDTVGVTVDSSSIVEDSKVVVWVTGGVVAAPASVTVRVVTVAGRIEDRTIYFRIKER
jgi:hypothetical protein